MSAEATELKHALSAAVAEALNATPQRQRLAELQQSLMDTQEEHNRTMKQATEEAAEALQRARDEAKRALAEQQGAFETERKRLAEQLGEADK